MFQVSGTDKVFRDSDNGRKKVFYLPMGAHIFLNP